MTQRRNRWTRMALAALLVGATALGAAETRTIRIGVKGDIKPMGYMENGALKGFDVDFARALVTEMNTRSAGKAAYVAEMEVVNTQDRFTKLEDGKVDMLVATVSITSGRQAIYRFSDPYFYTSIKLVTPKSGNVTSIGMIRRQTVGVLKNASTVDFVCQMDGVKVLLADTLEELMDLLKAKKIDAIAVDNTFIPGMLESLGRNYVESPVSLGFEPYGIVVGEKFSDDELKMINDIIAGLAENGTIGQLAAQYGLSFRKVLVVPGSEQ